MGITGLLPLLKESIDQTHISKFRNQRLAVDGYCWLHRALYGSTLSDMTGKSLNESTRWIQYCMGILDMLLSYEIEVYLVFDGKNLPAKERTEADRAASRSKNLELGYEEKRKGNKAEARSLLARSVDVSPRMAAQFMQVLRKHRPQVKFVVAPYEADAQLSFLCANDLVDGVISEDSDCVPYGCKSILFKLDKQSGQCSHLSLATLKTHSTKGFDLQKFDPQMMVTMCVAAGCDYAASPKNFGLKTSHRLVSKLRTPGRLLKSMKFDGVMPLVVATEASSADCVVYEYELEFYRAFMTFHHQTVFDPVSRVMKPLQPFEKRTHNALYPAYMHLPDGSERSTSELFPFLGHIVKESSLAIGIAEGLVDPNTLQPFNLPEPLEDSRPLQRRHSDISGSRCTLAQKGSQQHKRQSSPVTSASSTIKRRRSTGSGTLARQGVFVNEPPTNNSTTKLRLNGDGSLGQIKTSAPKITSFFKSGAPSINKLVVPEMSSRKASISNYFTSKKAPINIPVRETLKKINENTSERAAERLQRTAGLSDSPQTFKSDKQQQFDNLSMLSSQNSSTSTVSTASTPPSFSYDDSLSPPLSGPTKREVTYTRDNPLDIREFAYDNNASKGIANRAGVLVEHNENIIVDLVEDSDSNVSVEFVSTTGGGFPSANNVTSLHGRRPVGGAGSMVEQKEVRSKGNTNSVKRTSLQCGEQKENNVFSMFKFKASNAPTTLAISKRR